MEESGIPVEEVENKAASNNTPRWKKVVIAVVAACVLAAGCVYGGYECGLRAARNHGDSIFDGTILDNAFVVSTDHGMDIFKIASICDLGDDFVHWGSLLTGKPYRPPECGRHMIDGDYCEACVVYGYEPVLKYMTEEERQEVLKTGIVSAKIWNNIINRIVPPFSEETSNTTYDATGEGLVNSVPDYGEPLAAKVKKLRPPMRLPSDYSMKQIA